MYVASTSFWQLLDLHLTLLLQVSGSDWVTFRSSVFWVQFRGGKLVAHYSDNYTTYHFFVLNSLSLNTDLPRITFVIQLVIRIRAISIFCETISEFFQFSNFQYVQGEKFLSFPLYDTIFKDFVVQEINICNR